MSRAVQSPYNLQLNKVEEACDPVVKTIHKLFMCLIFNAETLLLIFELNCVCKNFNCFGRIGRVLR